MKESKKKTWTAIFTDPQSSFLQGRKGLLLLAVDLIALLLLNLDSFMGGIEEEPILKEAEWTVHREAKDQEQELAGRLETILATMAGVGRVEVLLTLERGPEYKYASTSDSSQKETLEQDASGGTREIAEITDRTQLVLVRSPQGYEEPVLITEIFPEIKGVVVVAQGAEDPRIKERITWAVQTALRVSPHKITVLPMQR